MGDSPDLNSVLDSLSASQRSCSSNNTCASLCPVNMESLVCMIVLLVATSVTCRTIYLELNAPGSEEISFMKKYGYLPDEQGDLGYTYTPLSIAEPVKKLQAFAGLPQTGVLDPATKSLFRKKRCGVKDIIENSSSRSRRYIVQQGWNKTAITYKVLNGASTLDKPRVETLMEQGLAMWAPHGGLHFSAMDEGHADIQVSFASGDHGDGFPFDGPGHVVAHAFPPPHGAMHFDDDELWGDSPDDDADITDFFAVAVHEIGHALGLSHSNVKASVMYPYYQVPVEKLHIDDILGMQELYSTDKLPADASAEGTEDPLVSHSSLIPRFTIAASAESDENEIPDLCYTNYDTIQVIQGKIYVFEEEWVWVLSDRKQIEPGYPKRFHTVFRGLPEKVNTVKTIYEKQNGNVVIFKGRRYWEFDPTFHLIKKGNIKEYSIPLQVPELTTVFLSNYNNKTYLIFEERFWRFDEYTWTLDRGYPKSMSAWRDLPAPVDSAVIWEGDTYFFRGPRFWRFDNELVRAHEYYPVPTAQVWFPCARTQEMEHYVTNDKP